MCACSHVWVCCWYGRATARLYALKACKQACALVTTPSLPPSSPFFPPHPSVPLSVLSQDVSYTISFSDEDTGIWDGKGLRFAPVSGEGSRGPSRASRVRGPGPRV